MSRADILKGDKLLAELIFRWADENLSKADELICWKTGELMVKELMDW